MEILRMHSKSGKEFRIMDDGIRSMNIHLYCIEYAKIYKDDDGEDFYCWCPLFEPKNKTFTKWDEVKALFDKVISEN